MLSLGNKVLDGFHSNKTRQKEKKENFFFVFVFRVISKFRWWS